MKVVYFVLAVLMTFAPMAVAGTDDEVEAIKNTIETSYVKGIHEKFNEEDMRAGFHEKFIMFVMGKDGISHMTRDDWMGRMIKGGAADRPKNDVDFEIPMVNYEGNAATARIEIYRDGKHMFTDYMLLYKVDGKWQITGKIYTRH